MEVVILLLLVILIVMFNASHARQQASAQELQREVESLAGEVTRMRELLEKNDPRPVPVAQAEQAPRPAPLPPRAMAPPAPRPQPIPSPAAAQPEKSEPMPVPESWSRRWLRNNPDLERFIGENLINKVGIAVLVLGIAFFVKYAIDQNWIGERGRVSIGLLCGALLVGIAHALRTSYRAFSSVLAGGGIAVFYFTITFAFHQYHLLSQTMAFIGMVVITGFAVVLSVLYDKIELAVIAAAGGFLTPLLVSTGHGNYVVLLTYLIILNTGLLLLSAVKRWPLVNILSLLFTGLLVAGWLTRTVSTPEPGFSPGLALLLVTILYLLFLAMNMTNQIRNRRAFGALDFSLLLFLTAGYYAVGMTLLHPVRGGAYQGMFTLGSGMVDLALAWYFFRREGTDRNLLYLLIGMTLTFLSLAVPVQLHGHTITLFWSAEFVLLYWLYQRSGIGLFRPAATLVAILALISLLMDWSFAAVEADTQQLVIYTNLAGLVTSLVEAAAFALYGRLLSRPGVPQGGTVAGNRRARVTAFVIAAIITYLTLFFGINLAFRMEAGSEVPNVYQRLSTSLFAGALLAWLQARKSRNYPVLQLITIGLAFFYHLVSSPLIYELRNGVLLGRDAPIHGWMHAVSVVLVLGLCFLAIRIVRRNDTVYRGGALIPWIFSGALVLLLSLEGQHLFVFAGAGRAGVSALESQYNRAILTILWAVLSFILMWLGMRGKVKTLRIVSLTLFSLALLKLFLVDLNRVSEGGKIAAFILLGVLLLTISFMYQKLKKIIIDEDNA
ncbi:MAG: hypothetical protein JWP27_2263 [Flaviaesturariibacter sp.]|nr:hypothetical protein [Flaviaesturariibacter sp.]